MRNRKQPTANLVEKGSVIRDAQGRPTRQGAYFPAQEKDSCGVGFICNIKGQPSRQIIEHARDINCSMTHRGGQGYETNTGDGAGILTALPSRFLQKVASEDLGQTLPPLGDYGCGIVFLPQDDRERDYCKSRIEERIVLAGQECLGWRTMPLNPVEANLGQASLEAMPAIAMLFIRGKERKQSDLERKLYLIRKSSSHLLRNDKTLTQRKSLYFCSLSTRVIVYKGMLTPEQLFAFFPDLADPAFESHLAMVHSRFSTNTFPSWDRAQPNRFMSHNGEINTLLGNKNWMNARQGVMDSELFEDKLAQLFPVIEEDCSDSGTFDNVLEFLLMTGRSLPEAAMMMIPEAWQNHQQMANDKKAFYEYHSCLMEPWDGPASIAFTDGHYIGAVLDRNGLRPSRYYITDDDLCIMASEVGVVRVSPEKVVSKGRLQPGRMFLIDFEQGCMVTDERLKKELSGQRPYRDWLNKYKVTLNQLPAGKQEPLLSEDGLFKRMKALGYTTETLQFMLHPLVTEQRDPLSSMGNDSALAVLSEQPRMLYDYFKQLFAQVTNPAIDSIREESIMALECYIGPEANLLAATASHANRLAVPHPILTNEQLASLKHMEHRGWRSRTLDITFPANTGIQGLNKLLDSLCDQATEAIDQGYKLLILSDRSITADRVAASALMAVGAVHQHLVKTHARTRIGLIVETGEAREVHHHCLLVGYGADAVNPWLAFESLWHSRQTGRFLGHAHLQTDKDIVKAYLKGVSKGIMKVMGKMGISTLQSYKGAQIFEAVGLADDVIDRCFTGTVSRIQGVGMTQLAEEMEQRHRLGFPDKSSANVIALPNPGDVHWRQGGNEHMWAPQAISHMQAAVRTNSREAWQTFSQHANQQATRRCTIRGLLDFESVQDAVPLDEVEPASEIVKRFATGAMSFGSISKESHESLAIAMNRIGGKSNTGEGGEDESRFTPVSADENRRSAIKQVASGRFGVTINYLSNADELQIKIVQGAKPGEGGELPGYKVDEVIASVRHSTPGVGLISPPPHHDIYSIEDIAQLIHDLKNANPKARISVKLGSETGVGAVAAGVTKAKSDHLVIAGHDGGTGASPLTSIKHAGLPWELGVAETHHTLVINNLRSRVVLQTDGQLKTGRDVAMACLLGAEEFGFATAPLIALGCIMMRKCHLNTCPVGIATQDPDLRRKFRGQPEHVVNYFFMVAEELRQIMADLGLRTVNEMVGRSDLLKIDSKGQHHWKTQGIDLKEIIKRAAEPDNCLGVYACTHQNHNLDRSLDTRIIELTRNAISKKQPIQIELPIKNVNRTVGSQLSNYIIRQCGSKMLPDDSVHIKFKGSAGQSFGAWLARGVTLEVAGDANDYVGKGLSGGRIIIYPPAESRFIPEENIIVGNVVLYGATSGEAFFRGIAAERFCVRNSGAHVVVEGIGDHGCEYMTGGRVVVLGSTGRNFAAGMSGGIAYIFDPQNHFSAHCNMDSVELEDLCEQEEIRSVRRMIQHHCDYTGSRVAARILEDWDRQRTCFVKVMPTDYKRVLEQRAQAQVASARQA